MSHFPGGARPQYTEQGRDLSGAHAAVTVSSPRSPGGGEREPALGVLQPRRRKAYLVATYTGQLDAKDAREPWFVYNERDPDHQDAVAELSEEERRLLRPVRQQTRVGQHALPAAATDDAELEERHAVSQGWCTPTNPATSATVRVLLKGTLGDSGQHTLSHARPSDGAGVFKPGSIDEFAISCEDLGDIHTLEVWHDNDGGDLQASRWKLDKVVVTCIQSAGNKGDFATKSEKTVDSEQWHFVLGGWLGCTPTDTSDIDDQLAQLGLKMELLEIELTKLRKAKRQILSATVQQCEHSKAVISLNDAAAEPATAATAPATGSNNCTTMTGVGVCLLLLVLVLKFSPASDDGAPSVGSTPSLPQCKSEMVAPEECDCELWAREEAGPTLLGGLCASAWDEIDRTGTWEAAEAHVRCTDCCTSTGFQGISSFGDSDTSSDGGSWISVTLMVVLCAVLVATLCTCDARNGGARRRQLDGQLRAGWQGARLIPPLRRGGIVASPASRRGRSRSPTRRRRSRSRSPGRSFASVSRDSRDSTYF